MIYEAKLQEDWFMEKCKRIAEEEGKNESVYYEDYYNILNDPGISVRTKNCLNAAEITYLEELIYYTKQELLAFRNFGKKSLDELENLMNKHNLKFKE